MELKESIVSHNAGLDGNGNSSYIDSAILRERDANTSWMSASDGTLEERRYYCQNWRADVSVILASGGTLVEWIKYSPYGIPFGLPGADTDSDGDCDATDISNFDSVPSYDVRYDVDLDGDNDATDKAIAQTYYQGTTLGWDTLSTNPDTGTGNRKGYAGYEYHEAVSLYHIRNRVLHPELGRWTKRDPLGYVDGMSVYEYVGSVPVSLADYLGLYATCKLRMVKCPCKYKAGDTFFGLWSQHSGWRDEKIGGITWYYKHEASTSGSDPDLNLGPDGVTLHNFVRVHSSSRGTKVAVLRHLVKPDISYRGDPTDCTLDARSIVYDDYQQIGAQVHTEVFIRHVDDKTIRIYADFIGAGGPGQITITKGMSIGFGIGGIDLKYNEQITYAFRALIHTMYTSEIYEFTVDPDYMPDKSGVNCCI